MNGRSMEVRQSLPPLIASNIYWISIKDFLSEIDV